MCSAWACWLVGFGLFGKESYNVSSGSPVELIGGICVF